MPAQARNPLQGDGRTPDPREGRTKNPVLRRGRERETPGETVPSTAPSVDLPRTPTWHVSAQVGRSHTSCVTVGRHDVNQTVRRTQTLQLVRRLDGGGVPFLPVLEHSDLVRQICE